LKRVKTNAHWQYDIERIALYFLPKKGKGSNKIVEKKIVVFEEPEKTKVDQNTRPQQQFSLGCILLFAQANTYCVIYNGAKNNERKKAVVPPAVKQIAGNENQKVLKFEVLLGNEPIQEKYDREKYRKVYGVEEHFLIGILVLESAAKLRNPKEFCRTAITVDTFRVSRFSKCRKPVIRKLGQLLLQ